MEKTSKHISVEEEINYAVERFQSSFGLNIGGLTKDQKYSLMNQLALIAKAGYNQAMDKMLSLQEEEIDFNLDKWSKILISIK
jgi:hypothetical protein